MDENTLLKKWLNDELTNDEKTVFEQGEDYALNNAIVENASRFKASKNRTQLNYEDLQKRLSKKSVDKKPSYLWMKIAAVLIVSLSVFYLFNQDNLTTINTSISEQQNIILPDESIIDINAMSSLSYNEKKWDKERKIKLKGEAYFKVSKGNTFSVETSAGTVKVLGTQFNIKQRNNLFQVTCYEGSVSVQTDLKTVILKPGDQLSVDGKIVFTSKIDKIIPSWKKGISDFENASIAQVFNEMMLYYDVSINYSSIDVNRRFTGSFTHANLEQALKATTAPMKLKFTKKNDQSILIYE